MHTRTVLVMHVYIEDMYVPLAYLSSAFRCAGHASICSDMYVPLAYRSLSLYIYI